MLKSKNQDLVSNKGYIALFSTIILSAVLVLLFVGMVTLSVGGMEQTSNKEKSLRAGYLASICAENVLGELRKDPYYSSGNGVIDLGNAGLCRIGTITEDGDYRNFEVEGEFLEHTKRMYVKIEIREIVRNRRIKIVQWYEF